MAKNCSPLQRSLEWCMGTPELPGIRRRIYYIAKSKIVQWPKYVRDANRRSTEATLSGSFLLAADAKWQFIDILADKSQLTSEGQGEVPSQTQLNKLTAVHPGVGPEATAAACYLNNSDNVFIIEDMKGLYRVVGSEKWLTKTTVAQDNGQGPTGATSTTISVEATDEVPAPFYMGVIETEDGEIFCSDDAESGNAGGNSGSNSGSNSGNNQNANSYQLTANRIGNYGNATMNLYVDGALVNSGSSVQAGKLVRVVVNNGDDLSQISVNGSSINMSVDESTITATFTMPSRNTVVQGYWPVSGGDDGGDEPFDDGN
ncbi:MAG: hypothetical protein K6E52_00570 [Bacteroidaceae bacterium]|nr:hypothetical protein [Bacteroidaceae bacterium]